MCTVCTLVWLTVMVADERELAEESPPSPVLSAVGSPCKPLKSLSMSLVYVILRGTRTNELVIMNSYNPSPLPGCTKGDHIVASLLNSRTVHSTEASGLVKQDCPFYRGACGSGLVPTGLSILQDCLTVHSTEQWACSNRTVHSTEVHAAVGIHYSYPPHSPSLRGQKVFPVLLLRNQGNRRKFNLNSEITGTHTQCQRVDIQYLTFDPSSGFATNTQYA